MDAWRGFKKGNWSENIDTRDFIQLNYTPYEGDESFLAEPTERGPCLLARKNESHSPASDSCRSGNRQLADLHLGGYARSCYRHKHRLLFEPASIRTFGRCHIFRKAEHA